MTIKEYVDKVLCVPVTRVGNQYIVEAIELVIDTHDHRFYGKLADIHDTTPEYLEKAMRDSKNASLNNMQETIKAAIFDAKDRWVTTTEYIVRAAEYYRRTYENKTEG